MFGPSIRCAPQEVNSLAAISAEECAVEEVESRAGVVEDAARKNADDACALPLECVLDSVANARVTGNSKRFHLKYEKGA